MQKYKNIPNVEEKKLKIDAGRLAIGMCYKTRKNTKYKNNLRKNTKYEIQK